MLDQILDKLKKELEDIRKDVDSIDKDNMTEENINAVVNASERFMNLVNFNIPNKDEIINSIDPLKD